MSSVKDPLFFDEPTVYAVDDEPVTRDLLRALLESEGYQVRTCASAEEFFGTCDPHRTSCILLDICLPDMSGLEVQAQLADRGISTPVIMMTDHGDVPMAVKAIKAGAVDIIEKPYQSEKIVSSVRQAIEVGQESWQDQIELTELEERYERLTPREREVMQFVVVGRLNKQIAAQLGLSRKTIEIHRTHIMHKMQAESLAQLVRIAMILDL